MSRFASGRCSEIPLAEDLVAGHIDLEVSWSMSVVRRTDQLAYTINWPEPVAHLSRLVGVFLMNAAFISHTFFPPSRHPIWPYRYNSAELRWRIQDTARGNATARIGKTVICTPRFANRNKWIIEKKIEIEAKKKSAHFSARRRYFVGFGNFNTFSRYYADLFAAWLWVTLGNA